MIMSFTMFFTLMVINGSEMCLTDGYHGHEAPAPTDVAVSCRPSTDLLRSKLDLHITDDDDVMSCSDDLQTDSSQNINDSDEHRTGQYEFPLYTIS